MFRAYKKYWMGYVDFTGRSTRSDYWLAVLANRPKKPHEELDGLFSNLTLAINIELG